MNTDETRIEIEKYEIDACAFSSDNEYIATYSSERGEIRIWKLDEENFIHNIWQSNPVKVKSPNSCFPSRMDMPKLDFALSDGGK